MLNYFFKPNSLKKWAFILPVFLLSPFLTFANNFTTMLYTPAAQYDALIINHQTQSIKITRQEVQRLYLQQTQFKTQSGTVLTPVLNQNNKILNTFSHAFFNSSGAQLSKLLYRQSFSGQVFPITRTFGSLNTLKYISQNKGSIGFIPMSMLSNYPKLQKKVKVLLFFE